jgi:hypothetical protein
MNNQAPTSSYLVNMFQKRSQIHGYNTRNTNNLNLAKCRTTLAENSFSYSIHSKIENSYLENNSCKILILSNILLKIRKTRENILIKN